MRFHLLVCIVAIVSCVPAPASTLDLSGEWRLALDAGDHGLAAGPDGWRFNDSITLPNTLATAGKGDPLTREAKLDKETLQHLHPKYSYIGPAWYQREIQIPEDWAGLDVRLTLERVIWESRVWVNGREAGMQDSLSTPHRHEIGALLEPGKSNTLTIRIDNRKKIDIGIGHAYSTETQTIWNGIVGAIVLEARPKARVESVRARPDAAARAMEGEVRLENTSTVGSSGKLAVELLDSAGKTLAVHRQDMSVPAGGTTTKFALRPENAAPQWCEFNPAVMKIRATYEAQAGASSVESAAGFRSFTAKDRGLFINGRPVFLRGTLECCIFPKTGHPDMTGDEWEKIMRTVRDYGLNHIRFHSWCPPRVAFEAADRHGIYLQPELPNWSFHMGTRPEVDEFFKLEGERIFREFGNHPSFVMFCLGNELTGDYAAMDRMLQDFKKIEPGMLMTSTAFSFSPRGKAAGPEDDFFISQETNSGWVRGQGFLNQTRPNTASDYTEGMSSVPVPLVTHEVGQYNNYPNLAELPKYEAGALRALGYEAIRDDLKAKRLLDDAPRLTRDSGKLAVVLYKEDMERALRTKDLAGIQLLDLHDFPGQSTATVGVLDAFWDSKGLVEPKEFRRFAGPSVPLARMEKRVWENHETFQATVEIAHFGVAPLRDARATWQLTGNDGRVLNEASWTIPEILLGNGIALGKIQSPLASVTGPECLTLTVAIQGTDISNSWRVWVYPQEKKPAAGESEVVTLNSPTPQLWDALAAGRTVLLNPPRAALAAPVDARFIPVFWSPLHFPNQPGTLGATIDPEHPVFGGFPTSTHTDWQWWELFATSHAMDLGGLAQRPVMPLRFVDKYNRNSLPAAIWEARVGTGKLLVCTLDLEGDPVKRPAARQLRHSIHSYLSGPDFNPTVSLSRDEVAAMFREVRYAVFASGSHREHAPEAAVDGDPASFWHTDWDGAAAQLPGWLAIDLGEAKVVTGLRYTPRQDMNRGRVSDHRIEISPDGKSWRTLSEGRFPDGLNAQEIRFKEPLRLRHLRLLCLTDHSDAGSAVIAELEPIFAAEGDVRDLGIIPGFNVEE